MLDVDWCMPSYSGAKVRCERHVMHMRDSYAVVVFWRPPCFLLGLYACTAGTVPGPIWRWASCKKSELWLSDLPKVQGLIFTNKAKVIWLRSLAESAHFPFPFCGCLTYLWSVQWHGRLTFYCFAICYTFWYSLTLTNRSPRYNTLCRGLHSVSQPVRHCIDLWLDPRNTPVFPIGSLRHSPRQIWRLHVLPRLQFFSFLFPSHTALRCRTWYLLWVIVRLNNAKRRWDIICISSLLVPSRVRHYTFQPHSKLSKFVCRDTKGSILEVAADTRRSILFPVY